VIRKKRRSRARLLPGGGAVEKSKNETIVTMLQNTSWKEERGGYKEGGKGKNWRKENDNNNTEGSFK